MKDKILFLDIDGVLNDHGFDEYAQSCTIKPQCMGLLNFIIQQTGCKIVLSSAWRYMISGGAMTLGGMSYLLRTHGFTAQEGVLKGILRNDAWESEPRADVIFEWLAKHQPLDYCVLDDLSSADMGMGKYPTLEARFVRVYHKSGLNPVAAQQVIEVLNGGSR